MGWVCGNWIKQAQVRVHWKCFVSTVMNLQVAFKRPGGGGALDHLNMSPSEDLCSVELFVVQFSFQTVRCRSVNCLYSVAQLTVPWVQLIDLSSAWRFPPRGRARNERAVSWIPRLARLCFISSSCMFNVYLVRDPSGFSARSLYHALSVFFYRPTLYRTPKQFF
jgi:hypothetical protein